MFVALNISTTGVTSGAGIPYPYLRSLPVFNGVHVLCVVFVDQCFFFCPFLAIVLPVFLSFYSNMTGATCGAGTAYPYRAPEFTIGF